MEAAARKLGISVFEYAERYNIAPTQQMPVILDLAKGAQLMRWGYVPFYERHNVKPKVLINARSETITSKTAFKKSAATRRCLLPADGFFEWKRDGETKTPYFFTLRGDEPFAIGGLYEPASEGIEAGYLLLTTTPNELMAPIHDRMPVIVRAEHFAEWLKPEPIGEITLLDICLSYPAALMHARPISSLVNSPRNDTSDVLLPPIEKAESPLPPKVSKRDLQQGELDLG